jgi:metal-responsive CopG/Arc/MetJ family transcriptional regulator
MWVEIAYFCSQIGRAMMKTIQMTIDETLLADVDRTVDEMGTSRSLFIRKALQSALRQHAIEKLEARHAAGYAAQPAGDEEVMEWVDEQVWGDA